MSQKLHVLAAIAELQLVTKNRSVSVSYNLLLRIGICLATTCY